jgi:uncharacterized delta-60 repeat protein
MFHGDGAPHVARLNSDGSFDAGFRPPLDFPRSMIALAEDGSGDVYARSTIFNDLGPNNHYQHHITRWNADGSADPAFSTGNGFAGGSTFPEKTPTSIAALVPTSNGKVYVGGSLLQYNGIALSSSLIRLNSDGTLDPTFAGNVPYNNEGHAVEVLVPVGDGTQDLYAGGRINLYNDALVNYSVRVKENGALDPTYAPALPLVTQTIAPAQDGTGDVFVSGYTPGPNLVSSARLLRFNRNGALVPTFQEPRLTSDSQNPVVFHIVPILDGTRDLYIGGLFERYNGVPVNFFTRIHADGSLASVVEPSP